MWAPSNQPARIPEAEAARRQSSIRQQSSIQQSSIRQQSSMLPEWRELDVDDASWIASIEASRREVFAELADL